VNAVGVLDHWANERPDHAAIISSRRSTDRTMTYGELRESSSRLAGSLMSKGIRPGDRVAILSTLSIDLYVALIGVLWCGAVPVLVDPGVGLRRARACFGKAQIRAIVGSRLLTGVARLIPELRSHPVVLIGSRSRSADIVEVPTEAPALLTFTSGSTGTPSAVVRSHGLLIAQNAALQGTLHQTPEQRWLCTLPVFVLAHLAEGATAILGDADLRRPGFVDGARLTKQASRLGANAIVASPSLLLRVADAEGSVHRYDEVFTGGAPVFPSTIKRIRALTRNGEVVVVYGSTEAEPIAHTVSTTDESFDASIDGGGLFVGEPSQATRLRLVKEPGPGASFGMTSDEFDALCVPSDQAGEIVVTGDHVVKGYLRGEGDTRTKVRVRCGPGEDIWHRTGDIGRLDSCGGLWLLGRRSGSVSCEDGKTAYPFEIEVPIAEQFGVRCALTPSLEGPILAVEAAPGISLEEIRASINFMVRVIEVPTIPLDKRHNAKVDYASLRMELSRRRIPFD
jgi:acyl-CoA synthetase (AMP-forming)/AMP-acid ligase II